MVRTTIRRRSHRRPVRLGAAAVEFAVVAPIMFMMTFGLIEFGRMMMVKNIAISSSREAARMAILPQAHKEEIAETIKQNMADIGVTVGTITFDPVNIETTSPGTPITVTVTVDTAENSWLKALRFMTKPTIEAATTMRRESV